MAKVLILYYSRTGNTAKMAKYVQEGVNTEGVETVLKEVRNANPKELLNYEGIIIGSPTYYGSMAGEIKKFLDESVKFHGELEGKVGGAFSSSANIGGGNETTILSILEALLIHGMIIQGDSKGDHFGPVGIGNPDTRATDECIKFGKKVAKLVKALF
ncbi:flavodoxin family protein [candidate division KSB1 bacterium]|nr:MAG: flavodoxin family protein [candidate division KSB1 bacterium]